MRRGLSRGSVHPGQTCSDTGSGGTKQKSPEIRPARAGLRYKVFGARGSEPTLWDRHPTKLRTRAVARAVMSMW